MAIYPAAATAPITFLNTANNQYNQLEIPLSAIYFSGAGIDASTWPEFAKYQSQVTPLLTMLASQGYLVAGSNSLSSSAAAALGLIATSTLSGGAGNGITIQISNPSTATGAADMTVTLTESHTGVTPSALAALLGDKAANATGLVYDATTGTPEFPAAFTGKIGAGLSLVIEEAADNTKTAFTLAPTLSADAADAEDIEVDVTPDPGSSPSTFSLTVSWTKAVNGVNVAGLTTPATNPFSYLLTFSGTSGLVPATGTLTLSGGGSSSPASINLLANT